MTRIILIVDAIECGPWTVLILRRMGGGYSYAVASGTTIAYRETTGYRTREEAAEAATAYLLRHPS